MFRCLVALFILLWSLPALAGFDEGYKAYAGKKWREAVINLRPLAEAGDARAMILLGNMYLDGMGVGQDAAEAFTLYRRAAVRDNAEAMLMVAALYQRGIGVDENPKFAMGWYGRAARLGNKTAAMFYALHLYRGNRGRAETDYKTKFEPDHLQAYKWFRLAALDNGNEKVAKPAATLAVKLTGELPTDKVEAMDAEIDKWVAEKPEDLGPLPEDQP